MTPFLRWMRPTVSSARTTRTPLFFDVPKSCRRSGKGTSSMLPLIVRCWLFLRDCATFSSSRFASTPSRPASPAITLRMLVPMSTRSPSLRRARLIFSPLTNVPLVEPRSSIHICSPWVAMRACLRDTMSSTRTMSRSLDRPMRICLSETIGNSPPWYFPLIKRKRYERPPGRGTGCVGALADGSCIFVRRELLDPIAVTRRRAARARRSEGKTAESPNKQRLVGAKLSGQVAGGTQGGYTCPSSALVRPWRRVPHPRPDSSPPPMTGQDPRIAADRPVISGGDPYGTHRCVEPRGGLPQPAWRLDADFTRLFEGEALIQVETLNIDAASLAQMSGAAAGGAADVESHVANVVLKTVAARG